jgi:hypothetical protein
MIIAHYGHRLPVDHDMAQIRRRASERGALWDKIPELYFKGFLLRERGSHGAIANSYSSLYLWRQDEAFRDFVMTGKYNFVTDSFGRAEIQTTFALDARRGQSKAARFAYKQVFDIPLDADLTQACEMEVERNRDVAGRSGTVVAAVGVIRKTGGLCGSSSRKTRRVETGPGPAMRYCISQVRFWTSSRQVVSGARNPRLSPSITEKGRKEKGRPVSRTAFPVLRQPHIKTGDLRTLSSGGLSPGSS